MNKYARPHHQVPGKLGLSRRDFIAVGGLGVTGYALTKQLTPFEVLAEAEVQRLSTATACIFIKLQGGPSHMDTFGVKEGDWTPDDWDIQTRDKVTLPNRIFPKLLDQSQHLAIVNSVQAWVPQHPIGRYWLDTAHDFNAALAGERPALGAVVAKELHQTTDKLPGFFALVGTPAANNGFLSGLTAPFPIEGPINPNSVARLIPVEGVPGMVHPRDGTGYADLWDMINAIDSPNRGGDPPWGKAIRDYNDFYESARSMISDPEVARVFQYTPAERAQYGNKTFGDACLLARNLIVANKGARFIHITLDGWDMHNAIYQTLRTVSPTLDQGLSALIKDLDERQSSESGRTLLDETLIVVMGEFGRTPPNRYDTGTGLSRAGGRDHYEKVQSVLFAGGGIRGGQMIGQTDEYGSEIKDPEWRHGDRRGTAGPNIRMEDIGTTIYSALGINWTREIAETPSRRRYQYIEGGPNTVYREIRELFE